MPLQELRTIHQEARSFQKRPEPAPAPRRPKKSKEPIQLREILPSRRLALTTGIAAAALGIVFGAMAPTGSLDAKTPPAKNGSTATALQPSEAAPQAQQPEVKSLDITFSGLETEDGCITESYSVDAAELHAPVDGYTRTIAVRGLTATLKTCISDENRVVMKNTKPNTTSKVNGKQVFIDATQFTIGSSVTGGEITITTEPPLDELKAKGIDPAICESLPLWGCPGVDTPPESVKLDPVVQNTLALSAQAAVLWAIEDAYGKKQYNTAVSAVTQSLQNQAVAQGASAADVEVRLVDQKNKLFDKVPHYFAAPLNDIYEKGGVVKRSEVLRLFGDDITKISISKGQTT